MIRYSKQSQTLSSFIKTKLYKNNIVSEHKPALHQDILDTLLNYTQQWFESKPDIKTETQVDAQVEQHTDVVFPIPSKLFVLNELLTGDTPNYLSVLHTLFHHVNIIEDDFAQTEDALRKQLNKLLQENQKRKHKNIHTKILQWFHIHTHSLLKELSEPYIIDKLNTLSSTPITYAVHLWSTYPNLYDYFVPLNVQHEFEKRHLHNVFYHWTFVDKSYHIHAFLPKETVQSEDALHHKCFRMSMMSLLGDKTCAQLSIRWFPNTCQKTIGLPNQCAHSYCASACEPNATVQDVLSIQTSQTDITWNPFQINTGATFRNQCNSITIWRHEESDKTFLHEMIHGYGWDFDAPETTAIFFKTHFALHPDTTIYFFEAYVETWATLLNVYMIVLYDAYVKPKLKSKSKSKFKLKSTPLTSYANKNKNRIHSIKIKMPKSRTLQTVKHSVKHNIKRVLNLNHHQNKIQHLILKRLKQEQSFVLFQVGKVLWNSGFQTWNAFFHDGKPHTENMFQQKTSVFSYFIVRSALLWDMAWFVKQFKYVHYHKNPCTKKSNWYEIWCEHLLSIYRSKTYCDCINQCISMIRENKISSTWILQTMRMTSVERY